MTTFDEWYNNPALKMAFNWAARYDLARAAYEAGARSRDEELKALRDFLVDWTTVSQHPADDPIAWVFEFRFAARAALKETK